jgi:cobaltochelatase CobS
MAFKAKYDGVCSVCGLIIKGSMKYGEADAHEIAWTRRADKPKQVYHAACKNGVKDTPAPGTVPYETDETPRATGKNGDAMEALAGVLAPFLADSLAPKIDAESVAAIINEKVETAVKKAAEGFTRTIVIEQKETGEKVEIDGVHVNFAKLLELVQARVHAYLPGPAGSGKSTAAMQVAKALNLPYGYMSLTVQTPESRVFGYMDANGRYVETEFYRCYKNGGVFCFDEMDNSNGNLQASLNSALENGHCAFPVGMVERHKDFVMVATGNTNGLGGNPSYPERRAMDSAFRDRFVFLSWEYDVVLERSIALGMNPDADNWINWILAVRGYAKQHHPRLQVTPRSTFRGATLLLSDSFTMEEIAEMCLFKGTDADTIQKIVKANPYPKVNRRKRAAKIADAVAA